MHYVISYDIENDRLRDKTAKILEKNGCLRVQKSVFVAPQMTNKHLDRLLADLKSRYARKPLGDRDSLLLIPLTKEHGAAIKVFGNNNILATLEENPLKIVL